MLHNLGYYQWIAGQEISASKPRLSASSSVPLARGTPQYSEL